MAMPTVVGVSAANANGVAAVTPAFPNGYTATNDDIAITLIETEATDTVVAPTGWAAITNVTVSSGTVTRLWAIWRRVQAGDTAPSIADAGNHIVARMIVVNGCATNGNPWDTFATSTELVSDTSVSIPGVTTSDADRLLLYAFSTGQDIASTAGATGWANASLVNVTERMDDWTTSGLGGGFAMATGEKATAGATGAMTATLALTANFKALMCIALRGVPADPEPKHVLIRSARPSEITSPYGPYGSLGQSAIIGG